MEEVSENHRGTGGGHAGAAGIDVQADMETVLRECRDKIIRILKNKPNPVGL
jgi:nanoRNase/pAp phosphatase (c-di-AMP/oligoRNAs hydrolase)